MMKKVATIIFSLIISVFANAQHDYSKAINDYVNSEELQNASISIYMQNLNSGEVVASYNPSMSLIPASSMKLFSTALALETFGKDYRFKTEIAYSGTITDSILNGNIYIIGGGDPCFASDNFPKNYGDIFAKILESTQDLGIKQINGDIISDISYFGDIDVPDKWVWEDIGNSYGSWGSSINYGDNVLRVVFETQSTGETAKVVGTEPADYDANIICKVKSANVSGDNTIIYRGRGLEEIVVKGELPHDRINIKVKGSMPNPANYVAKRLYSTYIENGIIILGKFNTTDTCSIERQVFHTIQSPSLFEITKFTNLKSFNLYAQMLSLHVAKYYNKTFQKVVHDFCTKHNINTHGLYIEDGCGLAHFNAVSSEHLGKFLAVIAKRNFGKDFINALPTAGKSGTLQYYNCCKAPASFKAKTGSLTRVRSLSGFLTDKNGDEFVFVLIVNNYNCTSARIKALNEKLLNSLAK